MELRNRPQGSVAEKDSMTTRATPYRIALATATLAIGLALTALLGPIAESTVAHAIEAGGSGSAVVVADASDNLLASSRTDHDCEVAAGVQQVPATQLPVDRPQGFPQ